MPKYQKNNFFILTGAMGAGKSTILKEIKDIICINEPARQILSEQRLIDGNGVPEKDSSLFTELLLSRSIYEYKQLLKTQEFIIFDRGIPDNIGYAELFKLDTTHYINAAKEFRFNKLVFFLPAWEEIYENDEERKMSFEDANQFGDNIKITYQNLGYDVVDVPFDTPTLRTNFILQKINN